MQGSSFTQTSKVMGKFLLKVTFFLIIIAGVDRLAGFSFKALEHNARGGFTRRDSFICDQLETDVLIMGSSRCVRHYNPQIVTDSLCISCYNAGQMGNGIILNYGRFRMIKERKSPSVIIYDLHPEFDLLVGEDNHKYLTWMKSHYDRDGIAEIFENVDATEKYKMMSQLYRYNSRIVEILIDCFHPVTDARSDGYSPLLGPMDINKIREDNGNVGSVNYEFDSLKMQYVNKFIEELDNSKLYIVVSPVWYGMDTLQFEPIKRICKDKRGVSFIDYSNDARFVHNNDLFHDGLHMNEKGADFFTRELITYLK